MAPSITNKSTAQLLCCQPMCLTCKLPRTFHNSGRTLHVDCIKLTDCSHEMTADTAAITGHWNNITAFVLPANVSLLDTAELFAKLQLSFYDSNIQGWFIKFTTLFWRPITAIR